MRAWWIAVLLLFVSPASAAELTAIDVEAHLDDVLLTLALDGSSVPRMFELSDPPRLVLDLPGVLVGLGGSRQEGDGQLVRRIRYSQFVLEPEPVTRIVVDLGRATTYHFSELASGYVLQFERPRRAEASVETPSRAEVDTAPEVPTKAVPEAGAAVPAETLSKAAGTTSAQTPATDDAAVITYMTVSTAYVSAGRKDGLSEGARLSVLRDDRVLGTLEVSNLSSSRASCRIVEAKEDLMIGDVVGWLQEIDGGEPQFLPLSQLAPSQGLSTDMGEGGNFQDWLRGNGLRGRLSGRYLTVRDRSGTGQSFSQPAVDARIEGRDVGGSTLDLSLDVRTRRTYREEPDGQNSQEGRSRVYRANGTWKSFGSRLYFTLGRQYSPELSSLSIFDGASLVWRGPRVSVGLLSGSQPDVESFGYSTEIREHGLFVQLLSAQGNADKLSVTVGAIGSYNQGEINREYVALQTHIARGRVSAYVSQDVDFHRGWKKDVEGKSVALNNTYASARIQAGTQTTLSGGFDNRRSIRLYRDYISPEVEFDDTYRQGVWAGMTRRLGKTYRLGARVKRSTGGSAGNANTYTINSSAQWRVSLRARSTRFDNELVQGWIHSGSASSQLGPRARVEVGGGLRTQHSTTPTANDDRLVWTNVLFDYSLGRSWYASISFERSSQGSEANDQIFSMVNYRF